MPGPQLATVGYQWDQRQIIKLGGLPLPHGGTMAWFDLNDQHFWYPSNFQRSNDHVVNKAQQYVWTGRGAWTSQDFIGRKVTIPTEFEEHPGELRWSDAKSYLTQSGEQYITTDNVTGLRVRCDSFGSDALTKSYPPYRYSTTLQFLAASSFAEDLATTSIGPIDLEASPSPGTATSFSVSYPGTVWNDAIWTVTVPDTTTTQLQQLILQNTTVDFILLVNFDPHLLAGVAHTIVIDTARYSVTVDGVPYQFSGNFPRLYNGIPAPLTNDFVCTLVSPTGTSTGPTISGVYRSRWEF